MPESVVLELGKNALLTTLMVAAPFLAFSLTVGLLVSLFQATTQINEQTLSFVPKIVAVFAAGLLFGPWMLSVLLNYTVNLLSNLPSFIH